MNFSIQQLCKFQDNEIKLRNEVHKRLIAFKTISSDETKIETALAKTEIALMEAILEVLMASHIFSTAIARHDLSKIDDEQAEEFNQMRGVELGNVP
jgi:hypothetical protein